jgi:hypothetical protein
MSPSALLPVRMILHVSGPPAAHEDAIRLRWEAIGAKLDERGRRLFAAAEVR